MSKRKSTEGSGSGQSVDLKRQKTDEKSTGKISNYAVK